jgi:hypothetical protein
MTLEFILLAEQALVAKETSLFMHPMFL